MAGGYQVDPTGLANGSRQVQALISEAESLASALASTFASLIGAVEDAKLSAALSGAQGACTNRMLDVGTVLGHIGDSLADSARSYQDAEDQSTAKIGAVGRAVR